MPFLLLHFVGLAIGSENIRLKRTYSNPFKIAGFIFYEESEGHVQLLQGLLGLVPNPGPGPGDPDGVEGSGLLEEDNAEHRHEDDEREVLDRCLLHFADGEGGGPCIQILETTDGP